jgi:transcription elongation factor Elf1
MVPPRFMTKQPMKLDSMYAHEGKCVLCGEIVKMLRHSITHRLKPDACYCLHCGQAYYMEIPDIDAWEVEQWNQKAEKFRSSNNNAVQQEGK